MITQKVAEIKGQEVFLHQIESLEEAKKENMPEGFYSFWSMNGVRIYSPGEYLELIQNSINKDYNSLKDFTSPKVIAEYYKQIVVSQHASLCNYFEEIKKEYEPHKDKPEYAQYLKSIDLTLQDFKKNPIFPDIDGTFRPTKEQVKSLLGENFDLIFPDKKDLKVFDELQKGK